jgi:serine protease AprX
MPRLAQLAQVRMVVIKPNVCAQGQLAIVAGTLGGVGPSNGTSFSGPIMAGMAACLWQSNPNATNMQVFESIEKSAHIYSAPTAQLGYGIPYFPKARVVLAGYNPTNLNEDELLTSFPNPFSSELKGAFFSAINQDLEFQLVNSLGQQVQIIKGVGCETCVHEFRFTGLNSLQAGTYYIHAISKEGKFHSKMIKVD